MYILIFHLTFLRERNKILKFEGWISLKFLTVTRSVSHSAFSRTNLRNRPGTEWLKLAVCGSIFIRVINYLSDANYLLPSVLMINIFLFVFYFKCLPLHMLDFSTVYIEPLAKCMLVLFFIVSFVPGLVRST